VLLTWVVWMGVARVAPDRAGAGAKLGVSSPAETGARATSQPARAGDELVKKPGGKSMLARVKSAVVKVVRLGSPAVAALVGFFGSLFALRKLGWPVAEFDLILNWVREAGWQKIRTKLRGGGKAA